MKITANIMMRNEERCISRCINSIYDLVDEVIIVDTGSTDKSIEIVKNSFGDKIKIFRKKWDDNFSEIRNYMIDRSSHQIILQIDADEFLSEKYDLKELREKLVAEFYDPEVNVVSIKIKDHNGGMSRNLRRIYRNDGTLYYYGYVHEELRSNGGDINESISEIIFNHDGYKAEVIEAKNKCDRNISLLRKTINDEPENSRWLFFIIRDLFLSQEYDDEIIDFINKFESIPGGVDRYSGYVSLIKGIVLSDKKKYEEVLRIKNSLEDNHPGNVDHIFLGLMNIKNKMKTLREETMGYIDDLMSLEDFKSFINSNGDHIKTELFYQLMTYGDYDKAFMILNDTNPNIKKEVIAKDVIKLQKSISENI